MSTDRLQGLIRKRKNPTVLELDQGLVPGLAGENSAQQYGTFCRELLKSLAQEIPAVRVRFSAFALLGDGGLNELTQVLALAKKLGYYVLLEPPQALSLPAAEQTAQAIFGPDSCFVCDGVILDVYAGSDMMKPYLPYCEQGKTVFLAVRTANWSAPELQDLITGSRLVHTAAADLALRCGPQTVGKRGYTPVGLLISAASVDSIRKLRAKYPQQFLLLDGYDAPRANAKNCSYCFNSYGWGGAVCSGGEISAAWQKDGGDGRDYLQKAVDAAQRMKRNLNRYITMV